MTCPICGGDTKVPDTRCLGDSVSRRRMCVECGYRFNTIEIDRDYYDILTKRGVKDGKSQNDRDEQNLHP